MRESDRVNQFQKSHDKQIYDTGHDKILMWLYDSKYATEQWAMSLLKDDREIEPGSFRKRIEAPLMSANGYRKTGVPIGFADLNISLNHKSILTKEQIAHNELIAKYKSVKTTNEERQEMRSLYANIEYNSHCFFIDTLPLYINFEVKTVVNIGETIRQINYYLSKKENPDLDMWYVVAPPFARSDVLKEQGIGFIEYKPL